MIAPDDILGYCRMLERIGAGGMGEIWKAEDTRIGRVATDAAGIRFRNPFRGRRRTD